LGFEIDSQIANEARKRISLQPPLLRSRNSYNQPGLFDDTMQQQGSNGR
jgi:hypothetical protein